MSYHEGSNWQAKKEDDNKPLYAPNTQPEHTNETEDILEMHIHNVAGLKDLTKWHKRFIYQAMNKYASDKVIEHQKKSIDDVADVIKNYNQQIKEYEQYCQKLEKDIRGQSKWISVDAELPEFSVMVWVYDPFAIIKQYTAALMPYSDPDTPGVFFSGMNPAYNVTHWMPMPPNPEDNKKQPH